MDGTPPATAPTITVPSPIYQGDTFTAEFSSGGDPDVACYQYGWSQWLPLPPTGSDPCAFDGAVRTTAGAPGQVELTLPSTYNTLYVRAIDGVGNVGPMSEQTIIAATNAPTLSVAPDAPVVGGHGHLHADLVAAPAGCFVQLRRLRRAHG